MEDRDAYLATLAETAWGEVDRTRRVDAICAIYRLGGAGAVQAFRRLLSHPGPQVRALSAVFLARLRDKASADALVGLLRDADRDVRVSAAVALGSLGSDSAVGALVAALADADPRVLSFACWALGEIGNAAATVAAGPLSEALAAATDPYLRYDAAFALLRIGDPRGREALEGMLQAPEVPEDLRSCCIPAALSSSTASAEEDAVSSDAA